MAYVDLPGRVSSHSAAGPLHENRVLEMRISRYGKRKILEDAGGGSFMVRSSPSHIRKKTV
jgi:hypothetical protein